MKEVNWTGKRVRRDGKLDSIRFRSLCVVTEGFPRAPVEALAVVLRT